LEQKASLNADRADLDDDQSAGLRVIEQEPFSSRSIKTYRRGHCETKRMIAIPFAENNFDSCSRQRLWAPVNDAHAREGLEKRS
jgi:hypothetical protein